MQPRVCISYRHRGSAADVHALHARLASRQGAARVFMDVGAIELGADFQSTTGDGNHQTAGRRGAVG
jgi:hypothetical protein